MQQSEFAHGAGTQTTNNKGPTMRTEVCPTCKGTGRIELPFGDRIREMREAASMSQEKLAERIGLSRPALANIEAGRQNISPVQIVALAAAFRCSADYLLGITND